MIDDTAYINRPLIYNYDKNICLMPILPYDFNTLPQFIPDKRLMRYFYSDDRVFIKPIDWYLTYLHILRMLHIVWYKEFSFFCLNPLTNGHRC